MTRDLILICVDRATGEVMEGGEPSGLVVTRKEPSDEQWGELARDLMMWLDMADNRPTGALLYRHLKRVGREIPAWLYDEIPDIDHVPSKGNRVVAVYKAMLSESRVDLAKAEVKFPARDGRSCEFGEGYDECITDFQEQMKGE